MATLQDLLKRNLTKINDTSFSWRNFVKDFRNTILSTASVIELTPYYEIIFRYRLRDLLYEAKLPEDIAWIVIWMNNLKTEADFKYQERILIPDYNELLRIRNLFDGSRTTS